MCTVVAIVKNGIHRQSGLIYYIFCAAAISLGFSSEPANWEILPIFFFCRHVNLTCGSQFFLSIFIYLIGISQFLLLLPLESVCGIVFSLFFLLFFFTHRHNVMLELAIQNIAWYIEVLWKLLRSVFWGKVTTFVIFFGNFFWQASWTAALTCLHWWMFVR